MNWVLHIVRWTVTLTKKNQCQTGEGACDPLPFDLILATRSHQAPTTSVLLLTPSSYIPKEEKKPAYFQLSSSFGVRRKLTLASNHHLRLLPHGEWNLQGVLWLSTVPPSLPPFLSSSSSLPFIAGSCQLKAQAPLSLIRTSIVSP